MTLSDLANIGQVIGSLGVVGSLIFVGLQVQINSKVNQASALRQNADYWLNYWVHIADPKFSKVYAMGMSGGELDNQQFGQFYMLCRLTFLGCANQHHQYRRGHLDQGGYAGFETAMREQIATFPGMRAMWQLVRHAYSADFAAFMDKQMACPAYRQRSMFQKWKQLIEGENQGHGWARPSRALMYGSVALGRGAEGHGSVEAGDRELSLKSAAPKILSYPQERRPITPSFGAKRTSTGRPDPRHRSRMTLNCRSAADFAVMHNATPIQRCGRVRPPV
jgi:hypothetical protein